MKQTMSTLGCPEWNLQTICDRANEYGFEAVDFRGVEDTLDVTRSPSFTTGLDETRALLADANLAVSGLSSSIHICETDRYEETLAEARRLIDLADELDTRYVRVFGGGNLEDRTRADLVETAVETMDALLDLEGARDVYWLVETHDHWTNSTDFYDLITRVDDSNVGALWDIGHTARVGGETPRETYDLIGEDIEYVHVKDAIYDTSHPNAMDDGWRYVPLGTGDLPIAEGLQLLADEGYDSWVMFEHEKRWHPELDDPEEAYPAYVEWVSTMNLE